ncbi:MAG: response regulator [Sterolibacteriaceae bacterium]|nr:response regulator [Candidatus Methylophosphatis haderslevensis]
MADFPSESHEPAGADPPGRSLHWLLAILAALLALILSLRFFFAALQEDLNDRSANERARLFVGEEIVRGIHGIEKDMYRMAWVNNTGGFAHVRRSVDVQLEKLRHDLGVLAEGGTVRRQIQLNIEGREDMVREQVYLSDPERRGQIMELIEIEPALSQISQLEEDLAALLAKRWQHLDDEQKEHFFDVEARIQAFLKLVPPYFERLQENANRLFFESSLRLKDLEAQIESQRRNLKFAELGLVALLLLLAGVATAGFVVRINHARQQQQRALEAMRAARDAAQQASRSKSEFVSRMSHELRTPLNAIIGFGELLEAEPMQPSHLNYVRLINNSGRHLLELVNQVLDLAKIEAGGLKLERIAFDFPETIESVRTMVAERAATKGIAFTADIIPGIPRYIEGDPTRLRQILINLLINAVKFTERGSVELRVAAEDSRIHFSVRDSGIGMDKSALANLFKSFTQADESVTRRFGGTGLGLVIAHDLIEAMGGSIDVESVPYAGTCFQFWVPLRPAEAPREPAVFAPAQADATGDGLPLASLVRGRVLLVDDNRINQQLAAAMLERLGLSFDIVGDGKQCIDRIEAAPYAMVLMDVEMPNMDGITATCHIREREARLERSRLPIVAMTANALREDREKCIAAGMDGYLAKPIGMQALDGELRRLFRGPPLAPAPQFPAAHALSGAGQQADSQPLVWERKAVLENLGGDEALLRRVSDIFVCDAPLQLREIDLGIENADWAALARTAHTLKGLFGTFALKPAQAAAARLEAAAKSEAPQRDGLTDLATSVRSHAEALAAALMKETDAANSPRRN